MEAVYKSGGASRKAAADTPLVLDRPSIVSLKIAPESVLKFERRGGDLVLVLQGGQEVAVRGFFANGVWSDSGFMRWSDISGVSWKEERRITLILISKAHSLARRLDVPSSQYGEARRLLKDRVKSHDLNIGAVGLDLGSREGGDSI